MERLDHVAELVHRTERILRRTEALMRRKEGDGCVSPVVDVPIRGIERVELEDGHEFHGIDTELLEVRDLRNQAGIRTACVLRQTRTGISCKPPDMQFVNDRPRCWPSKWSIAFPIVRTWIHDHALHGRRAVVACHTRSIAAVVPRHDDAASVRIEEHLAAVEAQATGRIVRAVHAVCVKLSRLHIRHEDMPVVVRAVGRRIDRNDPSRPYIILSIEEQQLHAGGTTREQTEIRAVAQDGGAERRASSHEVSSCRATLSLSQPLDQARSRTLSAAL
jgi:hypothetical protein